MVKRSESNLLAAWAGTDSAGRSGGSLERGDAVGDSAVSGMSWVVMSIAPGPSCLAVTEHTRYYPHDTIPKTAVREYPIGDLWTTARIWKDSNRAEGWRSVNRPAANV